MAAVHKHCSLGPTDQCIMPRGVKMSLVFSSLQYFWSHKKSWKMYFCSYKFIFLKPYNVFCFSDFSFTRSEIHGLIIGYVWVGVGGTQKKGKRKKGLLFIHFAFIYLFSSFRSSPWFYSGSRVSNSFSLSFVRRKSPQVEGLTRYLNWYLHCVYIKVCKSFHDAT